MVLPAANRAHCRFAAVQVIPGERDSLCGCRIGDGLAPQHVLLRALIARP